MIARSIAVMGLNVGHDRAACLLVDGHVVVAIAEERLSRLKHEMPVNADGERYNVLPLRAIEYCLETAGLEPGDLDLVVASTTYVLCSRTGRRRPLTPEDIRRQWPALRTARIEITDHHLAHAASALTLLGPDDAAVLVVDGGGSVVGTAPDGTPTHFERTSIFVQRRGVVRLVARDTGGPPAYGNSIGDFYQLLTLYLGFGIGEEGKLMGLAGYAPAAAGADRWQPLPQLRTPIVVRADGTHQVRDEFQYTAEGGYHQQLLDWFGPPRDGQSGERALDLELAASGQRAVEEALLRLVHVAHRLTARPSSLCLAGGVALNCVANGRIVREGPFERICIQPAAGDDGTALGNAVLGWQLLAGGPIVRSTSSAYLGRDYSPAEVARAIAAADGQLLRRQPAHLAASIVDDLVAGQIVAVCRGGSEFGPRALGHRSIVCDPRAADVKDRLNVRVKHRERFRPFAPIVTLEDAAAYFDLEGPSPHMLLAAPVIRPDLLPAVTHVDGTARVQTVTRKEEPFLHRLLEEFEAASGVPVLLNTSLNDREPIVEDPSDAIRCFLRTGIDVLYLENCRLTKATDLHQRERAGQ